MGAHWDFNLHCIHDLADLRKERPPLLVVRFVDALRFCVLPEQVDCETDVPEFVQHAIEFRLHAEARVLRLLFLAERHHLLAQVLQAQRGRLLGVGCRLGF